jgi:hypothetical protein
MESVVTNITVEVHCQQPPWAIHLWGDRYRDSRYRIYVNNDLITERTWIWDNSILIQENLWINVNQTATHLLKLESVTNIPEQAKFSLGLLSANNNNLVIVSANTVEITFKFA